MGVDCRPISNFDIKAKKEEAESSSSSFFLFQVQNTALQV